MNNKALVLAALAADSLALGSHWIYDTEKIKKEFGNVTTLQHPLADSYHKTKRKGNFTHYGDQTLLLLKSISMNKGFQLEQFGRDWQQYMRDYDGYIDKATQETNENLMNGVLCTECGSHSTDLGGASRIAPLICYYYKEPPILFKYARQQTLFTHNNPSVIEGALTLAKIACKVLEGASPKNAIELTIAEGIADIDLSMKLSSALASAGKNSREAIKGFGMACGISAALPGAIHLIASHENDLETALTENVMAGGDSAARGLAVGMILGAHLGIRSIPIEWLSDMTAYNDIMEMLERM